MAVVTHDFTMPTREDLPRGLPGTEGLAVPSGIGAAASPLLQRVIER